MCVFDDGFAIVTRRRTQPVGEPLFGEDWWLEDQRLFQDSFARRPATRPRRPRARRVQPVTLQSEHIQDALFTDADLLPERGGEDEPLWPDGPKVGVSLT